MVSPISSISKYPVNKEVLEVVRRLQSLGVAPSGNLTVDRQKLQTAELVKKQITLASNSEVSLTKLEGTGKDFSSTFSLVQSSQPTKAADNAKFLQLGLNNEANEMSAGNKITPLADVKKENPQYSMVGATQLAELNKLKLGLIA